MPNVEDIVHQEELLELHRRTLTRYLQQMALPSMESSPLAIVNGIASSRDNIAQIKTLLREWDVVIEDHPSDEETLGELVIKTLEPFLRKDMDSVYQSSFDISLKHLVNQPVQPPTFAVGLLYYLVPQESRRDILGDLEEEFQDKYSECGHKAAVRWYWMQVMGTLWAFLWNLGRALIKWAR